MVLVSSLCSFPPTALLPLTHYFFASLSLSLTLFFNTYCRCIDPCECMRCSECSPVHLCLRDEFKSVSSVVGDMLDPAVSSTFFGHAGSNSCSGSPWNPLLLSTLSNDQQFVTVALVVWANRIGLATLAFLSIQFYQFYQGFSSWFPMTNWISDKARFD